METSRSLEGPIQAPAFTSNIAGARSAPKRSARVDYGLGAEPVAQTVSQRISLSARLRSPRRRKDSAAADSRRTRFGDADADQPVRPGRSPRAPARSWRAANRVLRGLGRRRQGPAAGDDAEVGRAQLQRHHPAGEALGAGVARDLLAQRPAARPPGRPTAARSSLKVVSALMLLRSSSGSTRAVVLAVRQLSQPQAVDAEALGQALAVGAGEVADRCGSRPPPASGRTPGRRRAGATPAAEPGTPAPPPRRSPRSRAACRDRRRSWPGTCWPPGRSRR